MKLAGIRVSSLLSLVRASEILILKNLDLFSASQSPAAVTSVEAEDWAAPPPAPPLAPCEEEEDDLKVDPSSEMIWSGSTTGVLLPLAAPLLLPAANEDAAAPAAGWPVGGGGVEGGLGAAGSGAPEVALEMA
jgi:hypothetical protein